jgi:transposase
VSGNRSRIRLLSRKYFCDNPACHRKVFTERFEFEIKPYNRRLIRSNDLLQRIGLELGGNKGSTISRYVGLPVSPATMLRLIGKLEIMSKAVTSGIIGVDDWAFKKGNTYGSIIVDIQRREVIDLLPDREAATLAEWLKGHPEIHMVTRDRYGPYALGIKTGAPQASQVADRFHLLMNLGEATKRVFQSKGRELKQVMDRYNHPEKQDPIICQQQEPAQIKDDGVPANISIQRQYAFDKVKELYQAGYTIRSIARTLIASRNTVKKYITQEKLTKRIQRRCTNIDGFFNILLHQDNSKRTYLELYQTIREMGFNGKYSQFCNNMNNAWNMHFPHTPRTSVPIGPDFVKSWSPTRLSLMLYMDDDQLPDPDDHKFLKLLFENCPDIKHMGQLVKKFKNLFLIKEDGMLKNWIEEATTSNSCLKNFARNLIKDYDAVNNAVVTPYSNGPVEGQVNRLKNIKRRMYGRASFTLLRKMVLAKCA